MIIGNDITTPISIRAFEESGVKKWEQIEGIIIHYTRLENQLFPILEKLGIDGPSTVMWSIHDEVRAEIKQAKNTKDSEFEQTLWDKISDMIFKENQILYPMAIENLSEADWMHVKNGEEEIGFAFDINPGDEWKPITPIDIHSDIENAKTKANDLSGVAGDGKINLDTGVMSVSELNNILKILPIDISFVGTDDTVKYYSASKERVFPRSPGVIGRSVYKCHPHNSVDKVRQILEAFKDGSKQKAKFWLQLGGKFLVIAYYAVRDDDQNYLGCLEVSQDITELRALEGQQRLASWD